MTIGLLTYIAAIFIGYFLVRLLILERLMLDQRGKWVFITGCDSGFGKLLAKELLKSGVHVFAGCHTVEGFQYFHNLPLTLDTKKVENGSNGYGQVVAVNIDIRSEKSIRKAKAVVQAYLEKKKTLLHGLINNASDFSVYRPEEWSKVSEYQRSFNTNCLGIIRVTNAFKSLIKCGSGRIVTIGIAFDRLHGKFSASYAVSKLALEAYLDCLRLKMISCNVSVHMLELGALKTEPVDAASYNKRVELIWDGLSHHEGEQYKTEYSFTFRKIWQAGMERVASTNLQWVIWCNYHALFSWWPRLRYTPGYDALFIFVPLSICPTWIQDFILHKLYSLSSRTILKPVCVTYRPIMSNFKDIIVVGMFLFWTWFIITAINRYSVLIPSLYGKALAMYYRFNVSESMWISF